MSVLACSEAEPVTQMADDQHVVLESMHLPGHVVMQGSQVCAPVHQTWPECSCLIHYSSVVLLTLLEELSPVVVQWFRNWLGVVFFIAMGCLLVPAWRKHAVCMRDCRHLG